MGLEKVFSRDPLTKIVDYLSDPTLSHEKHRDDVNRLVLNLVVKYLGEYLQVQGGGFSEFMDKLIRKLLEVKRSGHSADAVMGAAIAAGLGGDLCMVMDNDNMGVECLTDSSASAAIVKEIIFNGNFEKGREFIGIDAGSGTGILLMAIIIAAKRARIQQIIGLGFEKEKPAVERSNRVLSMLRRNNVDFKVQRADVLRKGLFESFEGLPLNFWVSETFSNVTPQLSVSDTTVRIVGDEGTQMAARGQAILDPFHYVLRATVEERPSFVRDVKSNRTAMFPDIVKGDFVPGDRSDARIRLATGTKKEHVPLQHIGDEFSNYGELIPGLSQKMGGMRFPPR